MYTRCPHCTTIFRVTAGQLRLAHGDVPCVTCTQSFNALESLSDDITTLITTPDSDDKTASADDETAQNLALDDTGTLVDLQSAADREEDIEQHAIANPGDIDPDHGNGNGNGDGDDSGTDEPEEETGAGARDTEDPVGPADDEQPAEAMEFDAPEQTWTQFFLSADTVKALDGANQEPALNSEADDIAPAPEFDDSPVEQPSISDAEYESFEFQTADQNEWQIFLMELDDDQSTTQGEEQIQPAIDAPEPDQPDLSADADPDPDPDPDEPRDDEFPAAQPRDEVEPSIILPWLADAAADQPEELQDQSRPARRALGACAVLALLLAGQLIHYNRDALAAHATYGATIRQIYAFFGAPLYPEWPLDVFAVTGTEAITGRSDRHVLDVLANVVVRGRQPIGPPLIRIVLRDRWTNPVASRVFGPHEYLRAFDVANPLVSPGTVLPVEIGVADPGAKASGYVVDVCLPRRKTGLECQIDKDPFQ